MFNNRVWSFVHVQDETLETQKLSSVGSQGYGVSKLPGFGLSGKGQNRLAVAVHFGRLGDRNAPRMGLAAISPRHLCEEMHLSDNDRGVWQPQLIRPA
jgi:hypothetical protein